MKGVTGRLVRRFSLGCVLAALVLCAGASSASASVTIGSALATEPDGQTSCSYFDNPRGCLAIEDVLPGRQLVAPFSGAIVGWNVRLGDGTEAQQIRIRVVRRVDADQFKVISSGRLVPVPAGRGTYTFPEQLPISQGDQVGLEEERSRRLVWRAPLTGARSFDYNPSPPDGGTTEAPVFTHADAEHTFNAVLEPDCDSDGLGDETQDADLSSCVCKGEKATVRGTDGPDELSGTPARDVIAALGGKDKVSGLAGKDLICGGGGRDTLKGGKGRDKLYGQKGKDKLRGGGGKDRCVGGKKDDSAKKCEVEKSI